MKRSVLLIAAMIFFMAEVTFAGSVITQRVVNAFGFVKGSSTLNLSGQMNDAAMQSISSGNAMAVYNSLDDYLTFPTLLPRTKAGFGVKTATQNVSVNTKNGKFKWTEKDVTPYFTFVTGEERIPTSKAVLKSKGTVDTSQLAELETKKLTVFDKLCADQRLGYLASLAFTLQQKGKNYKFSYNKNDLQAKVSVDSKGRVTAKYTLSPEAAYPAILESEYIFTNKYDYSLEIIGDGEVYSGYYGPDQVEFRVTRNVDKFRYFLYKGAKVTNDFLTLELLEDTEVQAVFGTYDFSLKIVGNGSASAEFIGPDEVEVKVTENKEKFRYFTVNGEICLDSEMTLVLEEDTVVEAVFGTYDLSINVVGHGSASAEFIGPDEVEVKVTENKVRFCYFTVNGEKYLDSKISFVLKGDTVVEAVFGTYDLSLKIVGYGDASAVFTGPNEVEVKVTENKDKFRYFTVNGERCPDSEMTLVLEEDTLVEAIFGNYALNVTISGKGSVSYSFVGSEEVVVTAIPGEDFFDYFELDENISYENPLKLTLIKDTELLATFKKAEKEKYIVVDLSGGSEAELYPVSLLDDVPEGGWTEEYKTTKLVLRKIESGTFTMGSPKKELGRNDNETQHQVTLTNDYYIGVFEVTQKQYELIMGSNPSDYTGDMRPVEYVSYNTLRGSLYGSAWPLSYNVDEKSFFGKLRARTNTDLIFDLPTEAQWEYACRAGTTTALNSGKNLTSTDRCPNMAEVGRYYYNQNDGKGGYSEHTTVGSYLPNAWGLYDMHGNVYEWCLDWYQSDLGSDPVTEPLGASLGSYRVLRGGSWFNPACYCRSAYRYSRGPDGYYIRDGGFRIALVQNVFSDPDNQIQKDFEFEIESGTENTLPVFEVKLYGQLAGGLEYPLEEMGKVEYDGASGIVVGKGKHKLTWTPSDAYTNLVDEVKLRVEYEDVTSQATYLVLDLPSNKMRTSTSAPNISSDKCRTEELWLKRIEPGTFTMGSPEDELGRYSDETQHRVTLTKAYYIGVFEMTQKQCELLADCNSSECMGETRPLEHVSYNMIRGAVKGSRWPLNYEVDENSVLGRMRKKAGNIFDLPTEAQWEYACRAGTTTALNSGKNLTSTDRCPNMAEVGRYWYNGGGDEDDDGNYIAHAKVGSYLSNAWGLYDMHGNVYEWCLDRYGSYAGSETDPRGASSGSSRVLRGGGWGDGAGDCRSADRYSSYYYGLPDLGSYYYGFRVALVQ